MSLFAFPGEAPQLPPQQPPQNNGLPPEIATGQKTDLQVSPSGGEGLWNMAQEIHKGLDDNMKKTNTLDSIFIKLRDNAVNEHGFTKGTDDGRLPSSFQGNQKSGRDLDLIYVNDKFRINLDQPDKPVQPMGIQPAAKQKFDAWDEPTKTGWNTFMANNLDAKTQYMQASDGTQQAMMDSYVAAQKKSPDEVKAYGELLSSDGFKALKPEQQQRAIQLADKSGAAEVKALVNDKGFMALKDKEVPHKEESDHRLAQDVILDRALKDDVFRKSLHDGVAGRNGFNVPTNLSDEQRGNSFAYMAMYSGREGKGYGEWGPGGKMPAEAQGNALKNLWNNVLGQDVFQKASVGDQYGKLQRWVDDSGYRKPELKVS